MSVRDQLAQAARADCDSLVTITKRLLARRSETPPGDTNDVADEVAAILKDTPAIEIERHPGAAHVMNLVMRLRGASLGDGQKVRRGVPLR